MMQTWFFAHAKHVEDATIDEWAARAAVDVGATMVPGRDDYKNRSRAMGGWNTWVRDVPVAEDWAGEPLFYGIVVPCDRARPVIGKATLTLIEGFLAADKPCLAWDYETGVVYRVVGVANTELESWTDAGWLALEER